MWEKERRYFSSQQLDSKMYHITSSNSAAVFKKDTSYFLCNSIMK